MLGDSQIGKTSLMVKYVEGHFDEDYIQTLGGCFQSCMRIISLNYSLCFPISFTPYDSMFLIYNSSSH